MRIRMMFVVVYINIIYAVLTLHIFIKNLKI